MNMQDHISIIAQTENGKVFAQGMQHSDASVVATFSEVGLMLMAHTEGADNGAAALQTVEIILDDMQLNLANAEQQAMTVSGDGSAASQCLRESLENVNEYLFSQATKSGISAQQMGISVVAMQFEKKQFSVAVCGDYCCLLVNQKKIVKLPENPRDSTLLGAEITTQPQINEQVYSKGDVILLIRSSIAKTIGKEFIHRTLSRFAGNPEMVVRQINTRAKHGGMEQKPSLVLCRIDRLFENKRKWF